MQGQTQELLFLLDGFFSKAAIKCPFRNEGQRKIYEIGGDAQDANITESVKSCAEVDGEHLNMTGNNRTY